MFKSLIKFIDEPWIELKQIFLGGGPIPNEIIDDNQMKKNGQYPLFTDQPKQLLWLQFVQPLI